MANHAAKGMDDPTDDRREFPTSWALIQLILGDYKHCLHLIIMELKLVVVCPSAENGIYHINCGEVDDLKSHYKQ